MTVGWIDGVARGAELGRGVLLCGRWAEAARGATRDSRRCAGRRRCRSTCRRGALNPAVVRLFNAGYYRRFSGAPDAVDRLAGSRSSTRWMRLVPGTVGTAVAASCSISVCCPRRGSRQSVRAFMEIVARPRPRLVPVGHQGLRPAGHRHAVVPDARECRSRWTSPTTA